MESAIILSKFRENLWISLRKSENNFFTGARNEAVLDGRCSDKSYTTMFLLSVFITISLQM